MEVETTTEPMAASTMEQHPASMDSSDVIVADMELVRRMITACRNGELSLIQELLSANALLARQQDLESGASPLMAAASVGNYGLCQLLLEQFGAPWNAVDRQGKCAGEYATEGEHWAVVNLLVEWGTRAELILGKLERIQRESQTTQQSTRESTTSQQKQPWRPVEHEPCTKPDYLRQRLHYSADGRALLDSDDDAVMMQWEAPLMQAHASVLLPDIENNDNDSLPTAAATPSHSQTQQQQHRRVLNVGFGMGIIDTYLQERQPSLHIIIEAHPDVYKRMIAQGWAQKPNVRICFGTWQTVMPQLVQEKVEVDAIFYDTYGEHYLDLEDFHAIMVKLLSRPHGIYSFFNGLAPDNLFFHGVACQCVKLQLAQLGLDSEFLSCHIQVPNEEWEGIRRKYWHGGRDTYYLPKCTWNPEYLATGTVAPLLGCGGETELETESSNVGKDRSGTTTDDSDGKRQRFGA